MFLTATITFSYTCFYRLILIFEKSLVSVPYSFYQWFVKIFPEIEPIELYRSKSCRSSLEYNGGYYHCKAGSAEGRILILCGHIRQGLNLRFVHSSDCNTIASILQEEAIKLILSGKHVVLNIPTGGGKSFPQMAANIFAEGEKFFILILI